MKIYVTHASSYNFKDELYIPIRNSNLNENHTIVLPHEKSDLPSNSKEIIQTYDVILAEISYPSTGQGIEIGWADVYNKPIICIYKKGSNPSSSLKVLTKYFITYTDFSETITQIEGLLEKIKN